MRILSVMAHPDDAEIWAGATLAKHSRRGDDVLICTFCEVGSIRAQEAQEGANVLGSELSLVWRDADDFEVNTQWVQEVQALVEHFAPDTVITHWNHDSHPDHRATFEIVNRALIKPKIELGYPSRLYLCNTYHFSGINAQFYPDVCVDVSAVWEIKTSAIARHQSQNPDLWIAMARRQDGLLGASCGVEYAEGFLRSPILGHYWAQPYL